MSLSEMIGRFKYWKNADRIGPDVPTSYWKLFFRPSMLRLCKKKFKYFDDTAEMRPGAYVIGCSRISVGRRVVIRPLSYIATDASDDGAEIIIEDDVMIGAGLHIYINNHAFSDPHVAPIDQGYDKIGSVILRKGCFIGANVTILAGVTIGKYSVVGAGSVVTHSIPDHSVAVGSPARVIRTINEKRDR